MVSKALRELLNRFAMTGPCLRCGLDCETEHWMGRCLDNAQCRPFNDGVRLPPMPARLMECRHALYQRLKAKDPGLCLVHAQACCTAPSHPKLYLLPLRCGHCRAQCSCTVTLAR
jgi:hypothetical protein